MTHLMTDDSQDLTYSLKIHKFRRLHRTRRITLKSMRKCEVDPLPRSGHRIQCTDDSLYSIGGYRRDENDEKLFREVWKFDFIARKWKKLKVENLPKELASCSTLLSGSVLFLSGGTGLPFGRSLNESLYVSNLPKEGSKMVFKEIALCPLANYGHCMALNDEHLYMIGGTIGHQYSMDVHVLNLRTREWRKLFDCVSDDDGPPARYRHEMVCYENRIYIFGGGTQTSTFTLHKIPVFDLNTNRWQLLQTIGDLDGDLDVDDQFPNARKCHGCAQDPYQLNIVYINAGCRERPREVTPTAYDDTWRINLNTLEWKHIKSLTLPHGLYFHSVSNTPDGRMCVFGGISDEHEPHERVADLYVSWITIPKLVDVCWEAVQHYLRNGTYVLPQDIRTLGLPMKYENRLRSSDFVSPH